MRAFSLFILFIFSVGVCAQDKTSGEILNIESTITGSSEQPKVLYIVPWKAPAGPGDLYQPILGSVIEEQVLTPIDRATFQRKLEYYQRLSEKAVKPPPP